MKRIVTLTAIIAALVLLIVPWRAESKYGAFYNGTYYLDIYTLLSGLIGDGNDTEITRLAAAEKASASSPVAGTTGTFSGAVTATEGFATPRQASDSVSGNKGQSTKWYEDVDDGNSQYTQQIGALDGNFTDTIAGSTRSSTLNFETTGTISGLLGLDGDSDNHTLTSAELKGGFIEMTGAGTVIINDNATKGMQFCVFSVGANTVKVRSYKPSDSILLKAGTDLGSGVAAKVTTAGQLGCFVGSSVADKWRQISGDTWATE